MAEGKETTKAPPSAPQPRARDYAAAIILIFWSWLKAHKKPVLIVVAVLVVLGLGWNFWSSHTKNPKLTNDELILRINREVNITGDSNPAVLTVVDKEKVNQPFLKESTDGDKILLYYKSDKAVLYRPSDDKIIKTGSFAPPDAKVQVRIGTANETQVTTVKDKLKTVAGTKISTIDTSVKTDYSQTLVINVTDRYVKEAEAIAKALGAQQRTIPQNESIPDADIMVIVGSK